MHGHETSRGMHRSYEWYSANAICATFSVVTKITTTAHQNTICLVVEENNFADWVRSAGVRVLGRSLRSADRLSSS